MAVMSHREPQLVKKGWRHDILRASVGKGNGADLGGLEGADAHCNALAAAAGSKRTSWKAYLSTTAPGGEAGANARDRIGKGPWRNAKGVLVAKNVAELHSANNDLTKQTALNEKGEVVKGGGDAPNTHDILTGSDPQGAEGHAPHEVAELLARHARLQPGEPGGHGRGGPVLLLRCEVGARGRRTRTTD